MRIAQPWIHGLAWLLPLGAAAADPAPVADPAPLPAAVYARAEALLGSNLEPKVLNVFVTPHWFDGRDEFWYRRELKDGAEFVRVDAASGAKRPAFDHAVVAGSLASALGKPLDAKHLPIEDLSFSPDGKRLEITAASRVFDCASTGESCNEVAQRPAHLEWLMSPDGHRGVSTRGGNLWLGNAASGEAEGLTTDGLPDAGFGIYPDGWSANRVSRYPTPAEAPPLEARWAPDSRTVLVPF